MAHICSERVLFENRYAHSEEFYKEFYTGLMFKKSSKIVFSILIVLTFASSVFLAYLGDQNAWRVFIGACIVLFILACYAIIYRKSVQKACQREFEINGGKWLNISLSFTDSKIYLENIDKDAKDEFDYCNIVKLRKTKNYLWLISKSNLHFAIKTDGFTVGTPKHFWDFMRSKGINANPKIRIK